ncbi:GL24583 [Drosophila persimilis]|uniref:GL24583 n=1 Tax=Drosophila persimilis TaxID=7234 RepID=B4H611_DROPE|nr:GL24583 [Drosophila persimilis]
MFIYEEALTKVVQHMLTRKNIVVENESLALLLARKMGDRIADMARMTCDGASHAARSKPGYFDVEQTFIRMHIMSEDLLDEVKANKGQPQPNIVLPDPGMFARGYHTVSEPLLGGNSPNENTTRPNIPIFLEPFPGLHTYKKTPMEPVIEKDYLDARESKALQRLNEQEAINKIFKNQKPTVSLLNEPRRRYDVFDVEPLKRPAYLDALMPREKIFETDVYENPDPIPRDGPVNPFFRESKSPSTPKTPYHVDLGIIPKKCAKKRHRSEKRQKEHKRSKKEPERSGNKVKEEPVKVPRKIVTADPPKKVEVPKVVIDKVIDEKTREKKVEKAFTSGTGNDIARKKSHQRNPSETIKKHQGSNKDSKSDVHREKAPQRTDTADPPKKPKSSSGHSKQIQNVCPTGKTTAVSQAEKNKEDAAKSLERIFDQLIRQDKAKKEASTSRSENDNSHPSGIQREKLPGIPTVVPQVEKSKENRVKVHHKQKHKEKVETTSTSGSGHGNASKKRSKSHEELLPHIEAATRHAQGVVVAEECQTVAKGL